MNEDINNLSEIINLCKDDIEQNNENITATLDLEDLKSLNNILNRYKELEEENKKLKEKNKRQQEANQKLNKKILSQKGQLKVLYEKQKEWKNSIPTTTEDETKLYKDIKQSLEHYRELERKAIMYDELKETDLTQVYLKGVYDERAKNTSAIEDKIEELDNLGEHYIFNEQDNNKRLAKIEVLREILEEGRKENVC